MSIEELANVEVTTVSKRAEPQLAAPAAVYVITREEILRSGATSLPEALEMSESLGSKRNGRSPDRRVLLNGSETEERLPDEIDLLVSWEVEEIHVVLGSSGGRFDIRGGGSHLGSVLRPEGAKA